MKRQIKFKVEDGDSFERLTDNYFLGLGFKKFGETNQPLTYKKGSVLLNMITFNPLNWKSTVTVTLKDQFVEAAFDINSVGQMVTPKEEELWDVVVENFRKSVVGNADLSGHNMHQLRETKKDSWNYVIWAIIGAIVFGVPFGFLGRWAEVERLASMGAAIGAVVFVGIRKQMKNSRRSL